MQKLAEPDGFLTENTVETLMFHQWLSRFQFTGGKLYTQDAARTLYETCLFHRHLSSERLVEIRQRMDAGCADHGLSILWTPGLRLFAKEAETVFRIFLALTKGCERTLPNSTGRFVRNFEANQSLTRTGRLHWLVSGLAADLPDLASQFAAGIYPGFNGAKPDTQEFVVAHADGRHVFLRCSVEADFDRLDPPS